MHKNLNCQIRLPLASFTSDTKVYHHIQSLDDALLHFISWNLASLQKAAALRRRRFVQRFLLSKELGDERIKCVWTKLNCSHKIFSRCPHISKSDDWSFIKTHFNTGQRWRPFTPRRSLLLKTKAAFSRNNQFTGTGPLAVRLQSSTVCWESGGGWWVYIS